MHEPRARRRHLLFASLTVLALGGMLGAGLLAWRLERGTIDLGFLVPLVERALSRPDASFAVRIGSAELAWDVRDRRLALRARDVRVVGAGGEPVATVPALTLRPGVRALLHGILAPRAVQLIEPRLRLVRAADGGFDLGLGEGGGTGGVEGLQKLFARAGPAASLSRIEVRDGEVVATDPRSGASWRAAAVQMVVERRDEALAMTLAARLELEKSVVPLHAAVLLPADEGGSVTLRFDTLEPAAAAALAPDGMRSLLARVALPVTGSMQVEVGPHLVPRRVRLEAEGGAGTISAPELPAAKLPVLGLRVAAVLDVPADTITVESLSVNLDHAGVRIEGEVAGVHAERRVEIQAHVSHLATDELRSYWPNALAPSVRDWLASRVSGGLVREASLRVAGRLGGDGVVASAPSGSLIFDGLSVRGLDGLPPVTGIAGDGTFTRDRWNLRVARGAVGGLEVAHGKVDLDVPAGQAAVQAAVRGPLAAAVALAQRLGPAAEGGLRADTLEGSLTADVRLAVPLRSGARAENIPVTVSAAIRDAAVPRVLRGWSFSDGELEVGLRDRSLHVAGHGRLEGAPIDLVWREALGRGGSPRCVDVTGRLGSAERAALGLDVRPWLDGSIGVRARLVEEDGDGSLDVAADLSDASVVVPLLAVAKPPGAPGRAEARVVLAGGKATVIERFACSAGGASVRGRAALAEDGNALGSLDAAAAVAARDALHPPGHLTLVLRSASAGHEFVLTSDDAGSLFRALGQGADATGGRLAYAGIVDLAGPGMPFDGRLELHDFTLLRSPTLARVATLASLSGITSLLEERGVRFERLDAGIASHGSTVTITDALARGPSVNLLVSGTIDRAELTSSLHGTLVPSYYGINTAAGRVPLLGSLIAGNERQGVQAFDFDVSGPLASPRVSVHPLSSLAPGALRDLARRVPGKHRYHGRR